MKGTDLWPGLAAILLSTAVPAAHALCNTPGNWLQPPSVDIKIFIDYDQEQPIGFANHEGSVAFPAPLPKEMLTKAVSESTPVSDLKRTSYYEPDGKGNWRICRRDLWASKAEASTNPERVAALAMSDKYAAQSKILKHVAINQQVFDSTLYWYDTKGRISHLSHGVFNVSRLQLRDTHCYRYDERDRLLSVVDPVVTKICPAGEPDPRDEWAIDDPDARPNPEVAHAHRDHSGRPDGTWVEKFSPFFTRTNSGYVSGEAKADSQNGVTEIYGSNAGKQDDNAANTVVDSFGEWAGSSYVFLQSPVPLAVIDHPELIYKYKRRRQTYVDGTTVRLYELFEADEHVPRQRYYLLDGFFLRQEQLNAQGKVTRVITADGWHQPRPGPHPDVDDNLLTDKELHFHGHQVFHRVYDLDAAGTPKLVAISWGRDFWIPGMKTKEYDWFNLVYGTPDGKVRWPTQKAFEKEFDVSESAAKVFPDKQHNWYPEDK